MAFRAGRREKLAGGIIIVLVGIALLHYFIFQPKQGEFRKAKSEYDATLDRYKNLEQAPTGEINQYQQETEVKQQFISQLISDLNPCYPEYFLDTPRMQNDFLEQVRRIDNLRTEHSNIRWDFLGSDGWDFARELPEPVRRGRIVIGDLINRIQGHDKLIAYISNPGEKEQRQREYIQFLSQLGVDMNKALRFRNTFGELVPNLYLAYHAMLITRAVPAEQGLKIDQMLHLLRPGFDKSAFFDGITMHTTNKQLEALVDVLKMAAEHNVENVASVSLLTIKPTKAKEKVEEGAPPPTPAPAFEEWMMFDERMGMFGGEPGMFPGMWGGMPGMPRVEEKPEEWVAQLTGFKVRFQATNSAAMRYLYDLANSRRPYVIDDIAVNSIQDGKVDVIVTVLAYVWIADVCN